MPNICKSLPELTGEISRLRKGGLKSLSIYKSDGLYHGVLSMSALTLSVYNIHGDLDHLIRITYVTANISNRHNMAVFIVDQKHYDDAVALLSKNFRKSTSPQLSLPEEDGIDFGFFKVIRGGPEQWRMRIGTEEQQAANSRQVKQTVDRIVKTIWKFGGLDKAGEFRVPDFVWHNATSAETVAAMPPALMKEHCKGIFFACGVILRPTSFVVGAHYGWSKEAHSDMVA